MKNTIENIYSSAFFEVLEDEHEAGSSRFESVLLELEAVNDALSVAPELAKFCFVPGIKTEEKLKVLKNIFEGRTSPYVYNFLCILAEKRRLGHFGMIFRGFRAKYYEKFKITPVTVTSAFTLTEEQKSKLISKMETITGNKVELVEKTDKNIIGGVVVDYGGSRIDGSVKHRLESLKKEIAETVL
ncbi:MAG: ATP synthase F1 subunit delta [Oscillospiraceae bacterium]|jgi:F-type H+-transporting ATPase subunit delta|nr:ATP synthase F1 subunit delta [Oscillospiraceae bacterium]